MLGHVGPRVLAPPRPGLSGSLQIQQRASSLTWRSTEPSAMLLSSTLGLSAAIGCERGEHSQR